MMSKVPGLAVPHSRQTGAAFVSAFESPMSETRTPDSPPAPRFPICAQCKSQMVLERLEPGQPGTTHIAIFRCETCRLVEEVKVT
jgi:hypothetical protein